MHRRRLLAATLLVAHVVALGWWGHPASAKKVRVPACRPQVLVLSAMPLELNPFVDGSSVQLTGEKRIDDRTYHLGHLPDHPGVDLVLAMTGIGLVNAAETAATAFDGFSCPFTGAVFSGVAGSKENIGDVAVPERWTLDDGATWVAADGGMVRAARALEGSSKVALSQDVPVGDAACLCPGVDAATPVHLGQAPKVVVGGDGTSYDTFGGHAVPCLPGGGDIAGCSPCLLSGDPADALAFAEHAPALIDDAFLQGFLTPPQETTKTFVAQDMETAAFATTAARHGVPFLGVRAASDGNGDPLGLPGFPAQFFVYRQLAADNAAAVTLTFLDRWLTTLAPTGHARS